MRSWGRHCTYCLLRKKKKKQCYTLFNPLFMDKSSARDHWRQMDDFERLTHVRLSVMHPLEPWDEMPDHQHGLSKTFYKKTTKKKRNYTPQLKHVEYIARRKCSVSKQKNDRGDTWYMQKPLRVKRNFERLDGLSGFHRRDPFLILPSRGWETALYTCTFLLLMFTPHRRLDMTGIVRPFFSFFVRHAMGNKYILGFGSALAATTQLYGEVLVRKKKRQTSVFLPSVHT